MSLIPNSALWSGGHPKIQVLNLCRSLCTKCFHNCPINSVRWIVSWLFYRCDTILSMRKWRYGGKSRREHFKEVTGNDGMIKLSLWRRELRDMTFIPQLFLKKKTALLTCKLHAMQFTHLNLQFNGFNYSYRFVKQRHGS